MDIKRQKKSRKDTALFVRVSQQELERIREIAAAHGLTVSKLMREGALNYGNRKQKTISAVIDVDMI